MKTTRKLTVTLLLIVYLCLFLSACLPKNETLPRIANGRWYCEDLQIFISFVWDEIETAHQDSSFYYSYYIDPETNELIRCDFVQWPTNREVRVVSTEFYHEKYYEGYVLFEGELESVEEDSFAVREQSTGKLYKFVPWARSPEDGWKPKTGDGSVSSPG